MSDFIKDNIVAQVILCFLMAVIAQVLVYCGLAFLNKRFYAEQLVGFYEQSPEILRIAIFLILFAWPLNYLLAKTFQISSASIAGPCIIVSVVLATVVNSLVLDNLKMTVPIFLATLLSVFSCALVSWLLATQK